MKPLRILIADHHEVVRQGIRTIVEVQFDRSVVAEAGDGLEAIRQARKTKPDIALLDISFKTTDTHGANVMRKLNFHSLAKLSVKPSATGLLQDH